jgi:Leucine-rich repeat (LRR) protein
MSKLPAQWLIIQAEANYMPTLAINNRCIDEISKELFENATMIKNVSTLYAYTNNLRKIPKEIGNMVHLHTLDVSGNQLAELPMEIKFLTGLQILNLEHNHFEKIPAEIMNLEILRTLFLSHNHLTSLPVELGRLTRMERLTLNDNRLSSTPVEIRHLTRLSQLDLYYNIFPVIPHEREYNIARVLKYFHRVVKRRWITLYLFLGLSCNTSVVDAYTSVNGIM